MFTKFIQQLQRHKLSFGIKIHGFQSEFLNGLRDYQGILPADLSQNFLPSAEWISKNRQLNSIFAKVLCHLQLELLNLDDSALELELLNSASVIFATLSVCGRKSFKDMRPVDVLVIDEAGQSVEAETLIPFQAKPKKCLLVGDTKQLPATAISPLAKNTKFDRSLLWRLLEDVKQPFSLLDIQYRMHPEISRWPSNQYYVGKLKTAEIITHDGYMLQSLRQAPDFIKPYAFINVEGQEEQGGAEGYSYKNKAEVNVICQIVNLLAKEYKIDIGKQVGIITFYKAQADILRNSLSQSYVGINVQTVDGFQGGESDIIIISFVRANQKGRIGFLNDFRRLNVALTRARFSLIMVGHVETLLKNEHDVASLVKDALERKKVFNHHEIEKLTLPPAPVKKGVVGKQPHSPFFNKPHVKKHKNKIKNEKHKPSAASKQDKVAPKNVP